MNGSQENSDSYALIAAWMMCTFHNDDVHERYKHLWWWCRGERCPNWHLSWSMSPTLFIAHVSNWRISSTISWFNHSVVRSAARKSVIVKTMHCTLYRIIYYLHLCINGNIYWVFMYRIFYIVRMYCSSQRFRIPAASNVFLNFKNLNKQGIKWGVVL